MLRPANIKKRNGKIVPFEEQKITLAIEKAGKATEEFGGEVAKMLMGRVVKRIMELDSRLRGNDKGKSSDGGVVQVEQIQDIVEDVLLESRFKRTAKAYILYRNQHKEIREIANVVNNGLVDRYIDKADWQVKENSNMTYSLQGLNNYIASEVSKNYWLDKVYPESISNAHINGDFHIHDLNLLSVYCVGWDLFDLLVSGFTGVEGKIASKPAKHFRSALGQIVNFFYTLQGEAAGAQAFSNFDTLLAPFIRYDGLGYREVKQALQEFVFNINVPTRVGFQTPFTNVTLDLKVPSHYAGQPVVVGGEQKKETYQEFQKEMDLFNKAFLEVMGEGDASGRVFTFPIPTYNITKDFDWESSVSDRLWEVTGKYGLPYFSNFINSDMSPEDARSMCCRLRIDNRQLEKRGGGLFGANPLTGSIGVVTVNLPRIGYGARRKGDFLERLRELMVLAKESLEIKRKVLEKFTDGNLYPYTKFYLRDIKGRFGSYWKNHFSTIGLVGMNEAILNLYGEDIASVKGREFAGEVLDFMREVLLEFQQETGNNYNLEATPAEGTSYRLAMSDRERGKNPFNYIFYTNSTHLPVQFTDDIFEALDLQDNLQTKYTGGTVIHLFLGERVESGESVKNLVRKICENYSLPYFTLTPTFSVCPTHGYIAGQVASCQKCGGDCEVYSRIVGYLRPVKQWNVGKKAEFGERRVYQI